MNPSLTLSYNSTVPLPRYTTMVSLIQPFQITIRLSSYIPFSYTSDSIPSTLPALIKISFIEYNLYHTLHTSTLPL